jgi:uncharacterized repeat protein (TIGR01451 family)
LQTVGRILALLLLFVPAFASANSDVALESQVFVERISKDQLGRRKLVLEAPKLVVPGDRLVFILKYRNVSDRSAKNFVVTNPMPNAVMFQGAADDRAQVSVNGGLNWGRLDVLKVRESKGLLRNARLEDVTHVRWPLARPIPVGGTGRLSFRGVVR